MPKKDPHKITSILVIRSGALGDVIMSTPFLKNLRASYPKARISYLVGNWSKGALANNPYIDEIISFDDSIINNKKLGSVLSLRNSLAKKKFSLCFILDKSWMWNFFAMSCAIPFRVGFSRGSEGIWNTISADFLGEKHESAYNLDLLYELGFNPKTYGSEIYSTAKDKQQAKSFLQKIKGKNIIGIAPGGATNPGQSATIKRWPLDHYIKLCSSIKNPIIIFGGTSDQSLVKKIKKNVSRTTLYDATTLSIPQSKEVMNSCKAIVTHDSGSMHIASCSKAKLIALFGPTPAKRFAPKNATIINAKTPPSYTLSGKFIGETNQMSEISVSRVLSALSKSL